MPIFSGGAMWSCDFVNVNGTAFLVQKEDRHVSRFETIGLVFAYVCWMAVFFDRCVLD